MDQERFDHVYTCGPEVMMAKVFQDAEKRGLPVQASMERLIKCAVGLCGSCAVGPYRVCRDGPVFDTLMLREIQGELGVSRMDPCGRAVRVDR
jgi:dihydroorotate dehydrogenase electron transfer subunit